MRKTVGFAFSLPENAMQTVRRCCATAIFVGTLLGCGILSAEENEHSTQYEITPYLWAASFSGTTAADGEQSPPIDSDYSFFALENLDGVASVTFTARGERWGFLFDFLKVAYEDTFFEESRLNVTTRLEGSVIELAGTYQPESMKYLDIIGGVRYQDIDVELRFLNRNAEGSVGWYDPFIGLVYARPMTKNFYVSLRGDVGGGESDLATNLEAMFRYQFNKMFSAKFGYRYLKVQLTESDFIYDVSLDGFLMGLGIRF